MSNQGNKPLAGLRKHKFWPKPVNFSQTFHHVTFSRLLWKELRSKSNNFTQQFTVYAVGKPFWKGIFPTKVGAARKANNASSSRKANGSSKRQCSCQFWKYQPIKARQLQNLARIRVTLDRFWHRYDLDIHAFLQRWLLRRSAQICDGAWRCQCIVTSHFQCQRVCFESQIGA